MKCPQCEVVELTMTERAGIEIDYCTACRGVWLDRGELDKIIERSVLPDSAWAHAPTSARIDDDRDRYRDDYDDDRGRRRKKRGGFLGEIFDFD